MTTKQSLLLKSANEIIYNLLELLEYGDPEVYGKSQNVYKADKWMKYYLNEAGSRAEEREIIKTLKNIK